MKTMKTKFSGIRKQFPPVQFYKKKIRLIPFHNKRISALRLLCTCDQYYSGRGGEAEGRGVLIDVTQNVVCSFNYAVLWHNSFKNVHTRLQVDAFYSLSLTSLSLEEAMLSSEDYLITNCCWVRLQVDAFFTPYR